ncbi:hypothetical protein [Butyrivibrio sp. MB2005]|uniref:hypothetical protein n=1 Tax=Butyrivibrio sp. MB2005 TaxID=1280678 RepID=UPI00047923C4|nr:hypothetical protein [Butyrivibrio sp. MB2005]
MNENTFYLRRTVIIVVLTISLTILPLLTFFTKTSSPSESYLASNTNDETVTISDGGFISDDLNLSNFIAMIVE